MFPESWSLTMKKIIALFCMVALLFACAAPSFAAVVTEDDIIKSLQEGVNVGGQKVEINTNYIQLVKNYLDAYGDTITAEQYTMGMAKIEEAKTTWAATGAKSFKDIPAATRQELIDSAIATAQLVGVKMTVSDLNGGVVKLVNIKTGVTFEATPTSVRQTGVDFTALFSIVAFIAVGMAVSFVLVRKNKLVQVSR